MCRWLVIYHRQPINVKKMGNPIQGLGQPIRGPIQRRYGPNFICRVYFLRKSTDFYGIRTECQRKILIIHFLLYFLFLINLQILINHSLPYQSLIAPQFLPNFSPVCWSCAVELIPCLRGCKLEPSFKDIISYSRSLFSEWASSLKIHNIKICRLT